MKRNVDDRFERAALKYVVLGGVVYISMGCAKVALPPDEIKLIIWAFFAGWICSGIFGATCAHENARRQEERTGG